MHVRAISVRFLQKEVLRITVADGRFTAYKDKIWILGHVLSPIRALYGILEGAANAPCLARG